ncbi:glycoside hydrolase, partial [Thraustotheca clavata]
MKVSLALLGLVSVVADSYDDQAEAIVAKMSVNQWIAQMAQVNIGFILNADGSVNTNAITQCAKLGVGSFLNGAFTPSQWRTLVSQIQSIYAANNAPPALYGLDSVHGANYVTGAILSPHQINKGSTFNPSLVQNSAFITARDTVAGGVNWVFAPGLDLTVHKRWSRVYETFGEDPYLASQLGIAAVKGIQSAPGVAASIKHFIGYGATSNGDDRGPAYLNDYQVLNYHAPSFIEAVKNANPLSVMASYVSVNDVPMVVNTHLTVDLLRNDLGFNGVLLTDWEDIYNLNYVHKLVNNNQDAIAMSMSKSSVDMSMIPYDLSFISLAQNLVNAGTIPSSRFRQSAKRIIKMKLQMGLYQNSVPGGDYVGLVGSAADRQAALDVARESIILLKNQNNVLPLSGQPKIFLTGPSIDNIGYLCGGWTWLWQGVTDNSKFPGSYSIKGAFQNLYSDQSKISSLQGVDISGVTTDSLNTAKYMASQAQYTIIAVGEQPYAEMVGNTPDATLPAGQLQYIRDIASTGTKVILVLVQGRPRLLNGVADVVHAVIDAMLPCMMGGQAIAEIILGIVNPSGRLSIT